MKNEKQGAEKEDIIIYLNESSNTRAFDEDQQVHAAQFKKVTEWIDEAIKQDGKKDKSVRLQETISVLGSRGSGKSSFLFSLADKYKKNSDGAVIKLIDPTLIEQKGHIFLTIISQIKELVDEKLKGCECSIDSSNFAKRQCWEKKLESLAHGLPSVDGIGQPNEGSWQDPEYIMHKGLRGVQSASDLEKHFHEFVAESLSILEKKVFLLMLDDIDVDFRKGWPVLEALRKYLTTPQIVTILSGDIDLFAKAVRKQQWKNFGKELLINEGERLNKIGVYNELVTEKESQYLQKVLKPQRRVRLNTLWEKYQLGVRTIKIYDSNKEKEERVDIVAYYQKRLKRYGIVNPTQAKCYYAFLMSQPLRTQIQFLLMDKLMDEEEHESRKYLSQINILEPFLSGLYEKQVDIDLANDMPEMVNVIILRLLLQNKIISQAYQLQPTMPDRHINESLLALGLLFSEKVKANPFLIFDYIIKIGYTSNLVDTLGYNEGIVVSQVSPSIDGLCDHAEMFQDNVLRNVVGHITAYLTAYLDADKEEQDCWSGIIRLYGLALKAKGSKEATGDRIDSVFKKEPLFKRALAFFPLSLSRPSYKNTSSSGYSLFILFGTIGEFLKFENEEEVSNHIKKLSQVRNYPMPNFKRATTAYDSKVEIEEEEGKEDDKSGAALASFIWQWKESYPEETITISPYLLGKIVTRFYYALRAIEEKDETTNLGDAVHWRIIAFLHAVLLEDAVENMEDVSQFNHNNTNFSAKGFVDNLKKIKQLCEKEKKIIKDEEGETQEVIEAYDLDTLQFSRWVLSCPLLLLYLNMQEMNKIEEFRWFLSLGNDEEKKKGLEDTLNGSIYNDLCKVGKPGATKSKSDLPVFSGDKAQYLYTIQALLNYDKESFSVIESKNMEQIKEKYLNTVFSSISPRSLNSFWINADQNNELFLRWKAAAVTSEDSSETPDRLTEDTPADVPDQKDDSEILDPLTEDTPADVPDQKDDSEISEPLTEDTPADVPDQKDDSEISDPLTENTPADVPDQEDDSEISDPLTENTPADVPDQEDDSEILDPLTEDTPADVPDQEEINPQNNTDSTTQS